MVTTLLLCRAKGLRLFLLVCLCLGCLRWSHPGVECRGPQFSAPEPSLRGLLSKVQQKQQHQSFVTTNSSSSLTLQSVVTPCSSLGSSSAPLQWTRQDKASLQLPSLRQIASDGSLVFLPFTATEYRQSNTYSCIAAASPASSSNVLLANGLSTGSQGPVLVKATCSWPCKAFVSAFAESCLSWAGMRGGGGSARKSPSTLSSSSSSYRGAYEDAADDNAMVQLRSVRHGELVIVQCSGLREMDSLQATTELALNDDSMSSSFLHGRQRLDESSSSPPRLSVVFGEKVLEQGSKVSLKCVATGSPLPQITWTLDAESILEHSRIRVGDYVTSDGFVNSFVNISSAKVEDGGVYRCKASNGPHSVEHTGRINVYGRPFVKAMKNMTAIAGDRVQLDCPYSGYPVEAISWEKAGGAKLPQNHRQVVFPNGTLVIKKIERPGDEAQYRCVVVNKQEVHAAQVYIRVIVAPLISPFSAAPHLHEGMRSMLTCSVLEGDPPFLFSWSKDGVAVEAAGLAGIKVTSSNEFSSTLFINKVSYQDNGNFTCSVKNAAASANYTIQHNVKVPPKWLVAPNDAQIVEGHDVTIDCQATGYPQPRIWWEHAEYLAGSATPTHYQPVISNSHIHALENGSLIIKEVTKRDEGLYLCQATNGVGSGISKVVKITVRVPPSFKAAFSAVTSKKGELVELNCEANGEKPMTMVWSKDRMQFDPRLESARYQVSTVEDRADGLSVALKIRSVDRRDSALFTCTASNGYGRAEYNLQVIVQEPPDKPESLVASQIDSRGALISWTVAYSGNSLILSHQVEFKTADKAWELANGGGLGGSKATIETASGSSSSLTLRKLKPLTTYHVRVRAENGLGWGDWSDLLQFATDEEAPSSPPKNVHVYPVSSRSLQVAWKQPSLEGHNGLIKGYYLGYKVAGSSEPYIFKTISLDGSSSSSSTSDSRLNHEVKITELRRATKYSVIVQAFNSKGPGPQSDEVVGETMINDPPPAPALSVGFVSQSSVELHWSFDETYLRENNHQDDQQQQQQQQQQQLQLQQGLISGYYLHYKSPHSSWEERQISGQHSGYTFADLHCGTYYQFYLIAYNAIGKGDPSQVVATKTKGAPPEPPRFVNTFISTNSTAAGISLSAWKASGCPIKNFAVQYKQKTTSKAAADWILLSNNIVPDQRQLIEIVDLRPGTWYSVLVVAHSDPGPTEKEYTFATLTDNGGTVSPLDLSRPLGYTSLSVLVPTTCAVIALIVILLVAFLAICKKNHHHHHHRNPSSFDEMLQQQHHEQMCSLREDHLLDGGNILSVMEQRKESCLSELTETPSKIYFPSPYAMNQLQEGVTFKTPHRVLAANEAALGGQPGVQNSPHSLGCPGSGGGGVGGGQDRDRNFDHTYDIPFPPKWV